MYAGSAREITAIRNLYIDGKGRINYIMKHTPFVLVEDEKRVREIVDDLKKRQLVPDFSNDAKRKQANGDDAVECKKTKRG